MKRIFVIFSLAIVLVSCANYVTNTRRSCTGNVRGTLECQGSIGGLHGSNPIRFYETSNSDILPGTWTLDVSMTVETGDILLVFTQADGEKVEYNLTPDNPVSIEMDTDRLSVIATAQGDEENPVANGIQWEMISVAR